MARISQDDFSGQSGNTENNTVKVDASGQNSIEVPNHEFIAESEMSREGQDLVLQAPNGDTLVVSNYFSVEPAPTIESPDGSILTPNLVNSFLSAPTQYAQAATMADESPVGAIEEISGESTIIRADGTSETATLGSPIYKGDVIETSEHGAVNIVFIDETSMAVSENARLAIDEYQFDPATESGETNLSILRGVFVFTSGLIGRDDPDDVLIETPVGSIGIRGTIIAGKILPGGESEVTVIEGAIVVKNAVMETTLSQQYETVKLGGFNDSMQDVGVLEAKEVSKTYGSVSDVVPKLFSSINDTAKEEAKSDTQQTRQETEEEVLESTEEAETPQSDNTQEELIQESIPDVTLEPITAVKPLDVKPAPFKLDAADKPSVPSGTHIQDGAHNNAPLETTHFNDPRLVNTAPTFNFLENPVFENAKAGELVARVSIGNMPTGTVFTLTGAGATAYTGTQNNNVFEVRLNNIAGIEGTAIGNTTIQATLPGGQIMNWNVNPVALDAAVHIGAPGGMKNYQVDNAGAVVAQHKIGDFDGDGIKDTLVTNPNANSGDGEVRIISGANNSVLHTLPGIDGNFGYSADSAGDINNDGYADIIVGAPNTTTGTFYIINGTNSAATSAPFVTGNPGDQNGYSVAGIGDFDGDGKSDYASSAPGFDNGGTDQGRVYINYASGSITVTGHSDNMALGSYVAGIGDVNGDGRSDILIGTDGLVAGNNEAYIIFGKTTPTDIDTNAISTTDGFKVSVPDTIVAGGGVGDINGDGFDDFALSLDDGTDINTYVVYGKGTTVSNLTMTDLENPNKALKIHHAGVGGSQYNIRGVGDVDGDGFDDVQVGAVGGSQFVVHGNIGGNNVPYVNDGTATDGVGPTNSPDGVVGASAHGQSLVGDVDFSDGNFDNLRMSGGGGNNEFVVSDNAFKLIDGGKGMDTLTYNGNSNLDFSAFNFEQISGIERLHLGSNGGVMRLTAENLFNLLKSSDNGILKIELGEVGGTAATTAGLDIDAATVAGATDQDKIVNALNEQGSGATYNGTTAIGGETYDHYEIGGYNLYIDTDVTTNVV